VAATSVVLPYDLAWLGLAREQLASINGRLLAFMQHDRVALSGTMVALGVLYLALVWFGERRRVHWAARAYLLSNALGLASFFLFLRHGYFDPLHAVLFVAILVLVLVGRAWPAKGPPVVTEPDLANDRAWRRATLGQLLFVVLGIGLIGGGLVIAGLGATRVFVPEDLVFMRTTAAQLAAAHERLLPLIAHDRAGFGGALSSVGLAVLTIALWGVRRGARWVWWALALAGLPGLVAGLGIHAAIGYDDLWHLAPAFLAAFLWSGGLALTWGYLLGGTRRRAWTTEEATRPAEPVAVGRQPVIPP
jgi:hypothetical protein